MSALIIRIILTVFTLSASKRALYFVSAEIRVRNTRRSEKFNHNVNYYYYFFSTYILLLWRMLR